MIGINFGPNEELYSVIYTERPTPVTGHYHVLIVKRLIDEDTLNVHSVILHQREKTQTSYESMSYTDYEFFLDNWIKESPYPYKVIQVESSDNSVIADVLTNQITFRNKKKNPFLRD
jgi:hypothetical protein